MAKSVLILAGGFGTRLKAAYPDIPKPLVKVCGTPILHHCIEECLKYGFSDILISTHYQAGLVRQSIQESPLNSIANIDFIHELEPVGTGGAVQLSLPHMNDDFLLLYSDIYTDVDLANLMQFHSANNADLTTVVHPNNHPFDSDIALFDDITNRVQRINPHVGRNSGEVLPNMVNAAQYVVKRKVVPERVMKCDIAQDIIPELLALEKNIFAYETVEYLKDMGSPKRLAEVESDIRSGKVSSRNCKTRKKAIFLDRDGCLNEHLGYVTDASSVKLEAGVPESLAKINNSNFITFCVTNQPILARGEIAEDQLTHIHNFIETELGKSGAFLDGIEYCPHHPDSGFEGENQALKINCECRKPKPGLIFNLRNKWGIDTSNSWMIGDTLRDVGAGQAAGCWTILLSGGDPNKRFDSLTNPPDFIFKNLFSAVEFILGPFESLFQEAKRAAQEFIASGQKTILISGMSRSGKSTFASLLSRALNLIDVATEIFSTDIFLHSDKNQISREFDDITAEKALSNLNETLLSDLRCTFHIHETGEDFPCLPINLEKIQSIIIEGEELPYIVDANVFHIRLSISETERFSRFKQKYLSRDLSEQEINDLYMARHKNKPRYPKKVDLELLL